MGSAGDANRAVTRQANVVDLVFWLQSSPGGRRAGLDIADDDRPTNQLGVTLDGELVVYQLRHANQRQDREQHQRHGQVHGHAGRHNLALGPGAGSTEAARLSIAVVFAFQLHETAQWNQVKAKGPAIFGFVPIKRWRKENAELFHLDAIAPGSDEVSIFMDHHQTDEQYNTDNQ